MIYRKKQWLMSPAVTVPTSQRGKRISSSLKKKKTFPRTLQEKSPCSYQKDCGVLLPCSKRTFRCSSPGAGMGVSRARVGSAGERVELDSSALGSGGGCCALLPGFSSRRSLCVYVNLYITHVNVSKWWSLCASRVRAMVVSTSPTPVSVLQSWSQSSSQANLMSL